MEKKRVEKGKKYWAVYLLGKEASAICYKENGCTEDFGRFYCGNYFATKEEAESMANKIRAVFKGADVIQMPSAEEMNEAKPVFPIDYDPCRAYCAEEVRQGFEMCYDWLKDKIIK